MQDRVRIFEEDVAFTPFPGAAAFELLDDFRTENKFHGVELGMSADFYRGRWSLGVIGKVSLGTNHEIAKIRGYDLSFVPDQGTEVVPGGLLTYPGNIGDFHRNRFAAIPEMSVKVGYRLTPCLRTFVAYDLLYWSNTVRAGEQITLVAPVPGYGTFGPPFAFQDSSFWMQGIRVGAELKF